MQVNKIQVNQPPSKSNPKFKAKLKFTKNCEFPIDLSKQLARVQFIGKADDIICVNASGSCHEFAYSCGEDMYLAGINAQMYRKGICIYADALGIESGSAKDADSKMQNFLDGFLGYASLK